MLSLMNEVDLGLLLPLCVLYEMQNQIFQQTMTSYDFHCITGLRCDGALKAWRVS